jgi:hypothetical protein
MGWRHIAALVAALAAAAAPALARAQDGAGAALDAPGGSGPAAETPGPAAGDRWGALPPPPSTYGGETPEARPQPPPARRRPRGDRTSKHVGNMLWVMGAAALANSYVPMAFAGLFAGEAWLLVPVIGPFGFLAENGSDDPLFVIDGLVQLAGAALLVTGVVLVTSFEEDEPEAASVRWAPWAGPAGGGLSVVGAF